MEVDVELQRRTESLDQRDGPGLCPRRDGESSHLDKESRDGAVDHPQDLAQSQWFCSEQEPQRMGKVGTHCRMGCPGNTWSTRWAALSTMRRAPQEGRKPRRLQEIAPRRFLRAPPPVCT